jgi:hypothetical protein
MTAKLTPAQLSALQREYQFTRDPALKRIIDAAKKSAVKKNPAKLKRGTKIKYRNKTGTYLRSRPGGMADVDMGEGFVRRVKASMLKVNPRRKTEAETGPDLLSRYANRSVENIARSLRQYDPELSKPESVRIAYAAWWNRAKEQGWVRRPKRGAKFVLTPKGKRMALRVEAKKETPKRRAAAEKMLSEVRKDKYRLLLETAMDGSVRYKLYPKPRSGQQVYKTKAAAERRLRSLNSGKKR